MLYFVIKCKCNRWYSRWEIKRFGLAFPGKGCVVRPWAFFRSLHPVVSSLHPMLPLGYTHTHTHTHTQAISYALLFSVFPFFRRTKRIRVHKKIEKKHGNHFLWFHFPFFSVRVWRKKKWKNIFPCFRVQKNGKMESVHFSIFSYTYIFLKELRTNCSMCFTKIINIYFLMIYSFAELQDLAVQCVNSFIQDNDWSDYLPRKRKRNDDEPIDLWQTGWGRMLRDPDISDPNSRQAKKFQRRFRCPFLLFQVTEQEGTRRAREIWVVTRRTSTQSLHAQASLHSVPYPTRINQQILRLAMRKIKMLAAAMLSSQADIDRIFNFDYSPLFIILLK